MKSEVRKIKNFDTSLDFSDLYNQAKNELDVKSSETFEKLKNQPARYIFKQSLAQGGMKAVDKYFDANTKRHVAMAKLNEDAPKEDFDTFIHEAWLTAQLDHPNIIKIHDLGTQASHKF